MLILQRKAGEWRRFSKFSVVCNSETSVSAQAAEARVRGQHSAEVAALQGNLDLALARAPELERQLRDARCEMDELEASARSVHTSLQVCLIKLYV